ncbi:MAG: divergent polysaccharide deacetylase family protein [Candidatus Marinimicrobia bacterium]|nr:divergent polysaccharide deacetylase family protein [Candidatus Neomarinimicrobiota bacterium]
MSNIRYLQPNNKKVENLQKQRLTLGLIFLILLLGAGSLLFWNYKSGTAKPQKPGISQEISRLIGKEIHLKGIKKINLSVPDHSKNILAYSYQKIDSNRHLIPQIKDAFNTSEYWIHKIATLPSGSGFSFQINISADSLLHIYFIDNGQKAQLTSFLERQISKPPRLALIVNNFGYENNSTLENFLSLPLDLTIAITPGNSSTEWSQNRAIEAGKETIIHMPMEANDTTLGRKEKYLLSEDMSRNAIINSLEQARAELPLALGMDNYMGSRATKSRKLMNIVMDFVNQEGLYFIDNLNCLESRANRIASEKGLPTGVRNVFINNTNQIDSIRVNIEKALSIARRNGRAIAIARANSNTLQVLKNFIESNQFGKTKICFASEIVQ